jgi:hypoxanthine phosphoribosyltransferase
MTENHPMDDAIQPVFSRAEIAERVGVLGRRLGGELPADALLVSLLGGSVIFLADLVRAIDRPVRYEFIHVETSGGTDDASPLQLQYPIPFAVQGADVLLLKDVVTSGVTETYLMQQLHDHGAERVRLAALVDIPDERKTDVRPDYRVFTAERQGTLVGYGLKHGGGYGNLPYIGRLTGSAG